MKIENYIETQLRSLGENINDEFISLYESIPHRELRTLLATLHARFINNFKLMNGRLPTGEGEAHFWADSSRDLITTIDMVEELQRVLKQSPLSFSVEHYYQSVIDKCKSFLSQSGGSAIPSGMEKIELYYTIPIFILNDRVIITRKDVTQSFDLKLIGEGSYARVFKYKDEYYNKHFVLKRAKKELTAKELIRFKREFEQMSRLSSPYIVEVYRFNDTDHEYIMEYMDYTLFDYINNNNTKLTSVQRKSLSAQIIKAFKYVYSKQILHRDISPKNVLLKEYDDVNVVKISDFGLVKIPESNLTTVNTEFKGCFNDPALVTEGFNSYNILHETYALTRLIFFVLTGRINLDKITNPKVRKFIERGLNPDKGKRFQTIEELERGFIEINA